LPSGNRPDAINETIKEIIELKPNKPKAVATGHRQLRKYLDELGEGWTGRPDGIITDGRVIRAFQNDPQPLWRLNFSSFEISATKEHPFYVKGKGWVPAEKLNIGDVCRSASDTEIILVAKRIESEFVPVFNFEVQDTHSYFVGGNGTESVLVHNECPVHDYTLFPDWIDKYLNADRNGINHFLFGKPYDTCTCNVITTTVTGRVESYSLGKLAAHSPAGMSLQNQINANEMNAGYANNLADVLQAVQIELAMMPLNFLGGPIVEKVGEPLVKTVAQKAPGLLRFLSKNEEIIDAAEYAVELINMAAVLLNAQKDLWHKGSFDSAEESLAYHFEKHGTEVGTKTMAEYLDKAKLMKDKFRHANVSSREDGVMRFYKNGYFIDMTSDKIIVSFGKYRPKP
jgi:hypothetical protein